MLSKRLISYTNLFPRSRKYKLIIYIIICLILIISGLIGYLYSIPIVSPDQPQCDMVWMSPSYAKIRAFDESHSKYASKYNLYLYREQDIDKMPNENEGFTSLDGVPALFIHGNAGSFEQVRSIAARCSEMYYNDEGNIFKNKYPHARNIDFFTVDFNEELSAFKGLRDQVEYVTEAISFISDLYPENPHKNIILIGHSMGGLVARIAAASTHDNNNNNNNNNVNIILTLATPHSDPFPWLPKTSNFPDEIGLISIYSSVDLMVPPSVVTPKSKSDYFFSVDAAKLFGLPIDHQGIVWCGQLREKLSEALIGISGLITLQDKMKVFKKIFDKDKEIGPTPIFGLAKLKLKLLQSWVHLLSLTIFGLKWTMIVLIIIQLRKVYIKFTNPPTPTPVPSH
ncbi:conserved hypothetical protein [Candida dubliniensis CD36]|uniref:GPI inositol-deacylase n=1 Tax=Candida dubliniensis (strain CD36 / ATCC MYA-646 / CBS 7987 / NCPF 3949 / NRRL Y-17841) TaxID=573826 RepID=B9W7J4_CANDC|nr:conserved hypothetical protein [Candida dubliniensis CD36]CAX44654.1 conserved hypothetical protein [Candida dubliniensis CD36]